MNGSGKAFYPRRDRGVTMILFVVALVAIIGMAALALDGSHMLLNKTRLQNTVDAAALAGAKVLDSTGDTLLAEAEAISMFADNAAGAGHAEMDAAYADGSIVVTVQFSATLNPFVPGSSPPAYIRVRATNFIMPAWFSAIVGVNEKIVAASAVAGPSPTIEVACNLMPMMVCGDPTEPAPFFGYSQLQPTVLKSSTTQGNFEVGPGNFQLIRLGDGQGGDVVRHGMAGAYDACLATGDVIETEPGNTVGPVVQGFNTRFGSYLGPLNGMESTYPPDVIVEQPDPPLSYDPETGAITQGTTTITSSDQIVEVDHGLYTGGTLPEIYPEPFGVPGRREVAVAIGDCSDSTNGQGQLPLLGFGCFFLLQEAQQQGNESHIYGEFVEDCQTGGVAGPDPTTVPGPYLIQLYRDYGSNDS